jgi:excisionase family DNA binding protein
MMLDDLPPFMTVGQAAKALQLGRSKTYELTVEWECTRGASGLPFVRFGSQKRIPRVALIRLIESMLDDPDERDETDDPPAA